MTLAGGLLLALVISLLALLAIPVELEFLLQFRNGRQQSGGAIGWLFGAVRVSLRPRARANPKPPKIKTPDRERSGTRRVISMLQTEGFRRRLLKLVRNLLQRIHIRTLSLDIRLGLDDPADTGRLWGFMGPLAAVLTLPPVARIAIEPDFADGVFEVEGQGHVRIIPLQFLLVLLVFFLSPTTLRALRAASSNPR